MSKITKFFKTQALFSLIYFLMVFFLILFYSLSNSREIIYPICLALFFYIVYTVICIGYYISHINNIKRLNRGTYDIEVFNTTKQISYDSINNIHKNYNQKIDLIERNEKDNRRFIASSIHNLKTPITVSNLILQRLENKEIQIDDVINDLRVENEKVVVALNNILDIQRLDDFSNDFTPVKIDLYDEVSRTINDNKRLFINSHLFPKLNGNSCFVLSDSKWNTVLINQLISNAVKYSKDSTNKYIMFDIINESNNISLEIQDFGIGISEFDLPKIFEPFFTGENGRKNFYSSGIGLYLCKKICDKLNQKIEVKSVIGKGTIVKITYLTNL